MIRSVKVGLRPILVGSTAGKGKDEARTFRKIWCPRLLVAYQIDLLLNCSLDYIILIFRMSLILKNLSK